jgi:hypothetical protein
VARDKGQGASKKQERTLVLKFRKAPITLQNFSKLLENPGKKICDIKSKENPFILTPDTEWISSGLCSKSPNVDRCWLFWLSLIPDIFLMRMSLA